MKRNVSFVVCLPSRVAKSIANIERSVKHQNAVIFLLLVGLWAAHDAINVLRKKIQSVCNELETLKNGKGE